MKKILLPTDFSDNSIKAISYALKIFKNVKCKFYLMHTYMPPVYNAEYLVGSPGLIGLGDVMQETSMTQLEKLKSRLEKEYINPNHSFIVHTAFNTLVNEVMETVESEGIHLVVMGTTGATGAKEILFGTNTVHVIRKANCPVLVILGNKALFHDVPNNEIIDAINAFQAKEKINLLVMVQNKHTFMERLFIEPVIKKIGFHVTIPFMVIPQF